MNILKIVHISDSHLTECNPEAGDILVHSGDVLNYGDFNELITFRRHLEKIKDRYKQIILIPGNHDRVFQNNLDLCKTTLKETIPNIEVLVHNSFEFEDWKFFGSSWQPFFCNWAFNIRDSDILKKYYEQIPEDIDFLVTHCPQYGIMDQIYGESVGSKELAEVFPKFKKLKAHMFGHIHYSKGLNYIKNIWRSNAAIVDEQYQLVNSSNVLEFRK